MKMIFNQSKKVYNVMLVFLLSSSLGLILLGCGNEKNLSTGNMVPVKAMQVLQQDAPLSQEYAGQVKSKDEVKVQARVSGNVVEKYITGGQQVQAGQALYKIDSRQYESSVLSAQATLAQAKATLSNAQRDLIRDQELLLADAVSEQTTATQQANVDAYQAAVDSDAALLKKAQENLDDTIVYAPIDGRISVDDVAVGTYATAGSTTLVTLGSGNPIFVQFSISETEYLKYMTADSRDLGSDMAANVTITLSDGMQYPVIGKLVQADRALSENTGTLSVKALFDNPEGVLLPGMFARVKLSGKSIPNALLVPQRAVQQLLDKSFVIIVGPDKKSVSRPVTLGDKIGSYYVIKDGVSIADQVIVEGLTNLQEGKELNVTLVTPDEMGLSLVEDATKKSNSANI
jgi:membrane fusion protein, multidrug efflux system